MDATGAKLAWSYPSRLASSVFSKKVGGNIDGVDQLYAIRHHEALNKARGQARQKAAQHVDLATSIPLSKQAQKLLGSDTLLS
ncbi:MAG: hypothetical protein CMJ66_06895, partial [Planctomycetaceae bacterium]|nr:hypothetical protein [Planctomycetaceae bacterium]